MSIVIIEAQRSPKQFRAEQATDGQWCVCEDGQPISVARDEATAKFLAQAANEKRARALAAKPLFIGEASARLN